MTPDPKTSATPLETLLEEERSALLAGDLGAVAQLLSRKEALVAALEEEALLDPESVEPLRLKLQHNQVLLEAAMAGIRSVAARLETLQQVRASLDTYDANGRKRSAPQPAESTVERRA